MSSDIQDITINYEENGLQLVKELDKEILSKGAWTTILFRYQDWDKRKDDYGPVRYTIRRYRKMNDVYRQQSKFNISSPDQALKIIATLQRWAEEDRKT